VETSRSQRFTRCGRWTDCVRSKENVVAVALNSPEPKIRVNALRLSELSSRILRAVIWLRKRSSLQRIPAAEVRWQAMLTFGQIKSVEAEQAMIAMIAKDPGNNYLNEAALSGVGTRTANDPANCQSGRGFHSVAVLSIRSRKSIANPAQSSDGKLFADQRCQRGRKRANCTSGWFLSILPMAEKGKTPPKAKTFNFPSRAGGVLKIEASDSPEIQQRFAKLDQWDHLAGETRRGARRCYQTSHEGRAGTFRCRQGAVFSDMRGVSPASCLVRKDLPRRSLILTGSP